MANPAIPVPADLRGVRLDATTVRAHFTPTRADLLYTIRHGVSENWWEMGGVSGIGPSPAGRQQVVEITLPEGGPPEHFKISARDPTIYNAALDNWFESDSYVYPPGLPSPGGPDNWGQGPGVLVEPAPPPAPPPPPPPPAPEPPTEPAVGPMVVT